MRWLFSEGLAFGYKYCKFYVFNEFTDAVKYSDDSLSEDDLFDLIWNSGW